jgi:hypothetical protein
VLASLFLEKSWVLGTFHNIKPYSEGDKSWGLLLLYMLYVLLLFYFSFQVFFLLDEWRENVTLCHHFLDTIFFCIAKVEILQYVAVHN